MGWGKTGNCLLPNTFKLNPTPSCRPRGQKLLILVGVGKMEITLFIRLGTAESQTMVCNQMGRRVKKIVLNGPTHGMTMTAVSKIFLLAKYQVRK